MIASLLKMYQRHILVGLLFVVLFIVGLAIGLTWAWRVDPVRWTYADGWVDDYVVMVSTIYAGDNDLDRAQWRLEQTLGWPPEEQGERVAEVLTRYRQYGQSPQVGYVNVLTDALGGVVPPATPVPGASPTALPTGVAETTVPPQTPTAGAGLLDLGGLAGSLLPVCCVVILVVIIVAVLAVLWTNREKFLGGMRREADWEMAEEDWAAPLAADEGLDVSGPHMRFTARYTLGQDNYEESFSVESAAGGFFGECGVSAAERLGKEGPDKVTAFDLWLFDVASRETVTKVLLSDWGYKDDPLRTQLISRGGVILAERGKVITLETQNLRVDIKIVDFDYGSHEGLPENSFFGSLTLDMIARMKES